MTRADDRRTDDGPGALLRAAREGAGLGIEEVAEQLHLLQYVVRALEHNEYERLRGDTFVRGYLRNYARLLGLDPDEIVACRRRVRPESGNAPRAQTPAQLSPPGAAGAGRVGLVLLLLAASALYLFHSRGPGAEGGDAMEATVTVETAAGARVVPLVAPEHLSHSDTP